jgi:hypothetical protein
MPRRTGKDKDPQKMSSGTQREQQEEGRQQQSGRRQGKGNMQKRGQSRTGQRATRSARAR